METFNDDYFVFFIRCSDIKTVYGDDRFHPYEDLAMSIFVFKLIEKKKIFFYFVRDERRVCPDR